MLILIRYPQQSIKIGDTIDLRVLSIRGQQVRIGIEASKSVAVLREELKEHEVVWLATSVINSV